MSITFEVLETHPKFTDDELFSKIYITALYENEPAGIVNIHYINNETYDKKLKTVLDFFVYKMHQGYPDVKELYENRDKNLLGFVKHFHNYGKTIEDIESNITEIYGKKHLEFIDYWVNKPSRELTFVFDDKTTAFRGVYNGEIVKQFRKAKCMRKKGIGKALLEKSIEVVAQKNMSLWESNNKTAQGVKFWQVAFDNYTIIKSSENTKDFPLGRSFAVKKMA